MSGTRQIHLLVLLFLIGTVLTDDATSITVEKEVVETLGEDQNFTGLYQIKFSSNEQPKKDQQWFFFIQIQRTQNQKAIGQPQGLVYKIKGQDGKFKDLQHNQCKIDKNWDSCFLTKSDFDPSKDKIEFQLSCDSLCQVNIFAYFDYAKKLQANHQYVLDFQKTPYSQVFRLNTENLTDYDEIQIVLEPMGWLKYPEPINLYANWGENLPTEHKNDYKGVHIWNDGLAIFVRSSEVEKSQSKTLTILVQGPQRNILIFKAMTRKHSDAKSLAIHVPQFDHVLADEIRQYRFDIKQKNASYNIITSVFTGAINPPVFSNPNKKGQILPSVQADEQYSKMSYHFSSQYIATHNLTAIQFVITGKKNSTYVLECWATQRQTVPLFEHIGKTSIMEEKQVDQYFIRVEETIEADKEKKQSRIQIDVNIISGDAKVSFYQCKQFTNNGFGRGRGMGRGMGRGCHIKPEQLANIKDYTDKFGELTPVKKDGNIGLVKYWFDVNWQGALKEEENQEQIVMMILVILENINNGETSYEIVYKNNERIHPLKEGDLFVDRTTLGEQRVYELAFNDPDIVQIKIHLTKISGEMKIEGTYEDPRLKDNNLTTIKPVHNMLIFPIDPAKSLRSIYVQVKGIQDCLFTLMTQIIRKSESDPNKNNSKGYNEVIIYENQPYQFVIEPKQKIVLQIRLKGDSAAFHLKSNIPLDLCGTQNLDQPPFSPNCEVHEKSALAIDEIVILEKGHVANLGVLNNNDEKANLKLQISNTEEEACQIAPLGHVMQKYIGTDGKDMDGDTNHCLIYYLHRAADFEVNVRIDNGVYNRRGQIMIKIGEEQIEMIDPVHHFSKQQIEILCGPQLKDKQMQYCYMQIHISNLVGTTVHVMAQYTDTLMRLIDGFSHTAHTRMYKKDPKTFYYRILNKKQTTIFLQNKAGEYKILARVVSVDEFEKGITEKSKDLMPNINNKQFQSSNPFYFLEQIITIKESEIKSMCKEDECVLLISVFLTGDSEYKQDGKFIIECTQETRMLSPGVPAQGYLPRQAVDFYTYQNTIQDGSIIVSINNQNVKCLNIYINQGTNRPTISSNKKQAKSSNTLILENSPKDLYSITLESSSEHCPYTIEVSTSKSLIKQIKKGLFSDLDMGLGDIQYLLYENFINETFKVLSMHKSGEVTLSVKTIKNSELTQNADFDSYKDYPWVNKDSVRIDNTRQNDKKNDNYCVNCLYLIKVEALRKTEASIIIPTPDVQIPLTTDALMKDILKKDETTRYRIFTDSKSSFQIHVQYGKVKIQVIDSQNSDNPVLTKEYEASKSPVTQKFNLKKNEDYEFLRYSRIVITALDESYFSFGIITNENPDKRGDSLKYGIPFYLFLDKDKEKCVGVNIDRYDDNLLFSFDSLKDQAIDNIVIRIRNKDGNTLDYAKSTGKDEIIVTLPPVFNLGDHQVCVKNVKESCSVTVVQSSPLIYFPSEMPIMVQQELNLTFGSNGKNIIEINECTGRMITGIYSQFANLKEESSEIKQRRRRNNIVEFYFYGPIFANFRIPKGSVRWFPYEQTKGIGVGYDEYETGSLRVTKKEDSIELIAQPLMNAKKERTSVIDQVSYIAYAAKEEQELYSAMNCGDGDYLMEEKADLGGALQSININFKIQDLFKRFGGENYFLMGLKAEVRLKNPSGKIQLYRFYYPYQQVTKEMLEGEQEWEEIEQDDDGIYLEDVMMVIGWITFFMMIFFLAYFCYRKYCYSAIRRRRLGAEPTGMQLRYTDFSNTH